MKLVAGFAFLLNTILFATYYSVSKEALGRIDPIIFSFCEMTSLVPIALCVLLCSWRDMNRFVIKRGIFLGSWLYLALITIAIALKYTTATSTAFFPSLNGFLAALIAWVFLRQPVQKLTWLAGVLSVVGAILLLSYSSTGTWRGSVIAFLGGVFFTCYVFLTDHEPKEKIAPWPLLGIELLTMALWSNLVVLLFGDWRAAHPSLPHDLWVVLYVAGACTLIPTLITVLMQKHLSPVTVSFIYILEPVLGAVVATIYLHEMLPVQCYVGGCLVVVGAIIHTWGSLLTRQTSREQSREQSTGQLVGALDVGSATCLESQLPIETVPVWNDHSHLPVGSVQYSFSRQGEKMLVQRRRQDRLQRLCSPGVMMQMNILTRPSAGAGVSRTPPVYRPFESLRDTPFNINLQNTLPNPTIEAAEMRSQ